MPLYVRETPLHELSSDVLAQRSELIELRSLRVSLVVHMPAVLHDAVSGNAKRKLCRDEPVLEAKWAPREREAVWLLSDAYEAALGVATLILKLQFGVSGLQYSKSGNDEAVCEGLEEARLYI